jgi:hypothetical protein
MARGCRMDNIFKPRLGNQNLHLPRPIRGCARPPRKGGRAHRLSAVLAASIVLIRSLVHSTHPHFVK